MRAVSVRCPNCGASLDAALDAPAVTCTYCGTTARVQGRSRVWQVPQPLPPTSGPPLPVARQKPTALIVVPLLIVAAVIALPIIVVSTKGGLRLNRAQLGWWGTTPVLADVDGDGADDVIGFSRYVLDGDRMHLAAFSGATGKKLWETPKLGTYTDVYQGVIATADDTVVVAMPTGALRGYARTTGAARWETQVGEKVDHLCAGDRTGTIAVGTADKRWHRVTLADGGRADMVPLRVAERDEGAVARVLGTAEAGGCEPLASSEREGMPGLRTAESWSGMPEVEGMRVERIARRDGGPVIAIGTKQPGSAVPMMAALDGARVRWKVIVPATDPLNTRAEDHLMTIGGDVVVAAYEISSSNEPPHLTAFALADGRRLWDVPVQKGTTIVMTALAIAGTNVVLSSWGHLQAYDLATGARQFRIGQL